MGLQIHLSAAVLGTFQAGGVARQLFVAKSRWHQADAIHIACRHTHGAAQADKQGVDVGTLAAQVACLQHGFDIALAAAACLRFAPRVGHDPVVNGACFLRVGFRALRGFECGAAHDAIGGQQVCGACVVVQGVCVFAGERMCCGLADVDKTALRLHAAGQFDKRGHACSELGVEHACAVRAIAGHA